jgi:DNA-directed RNA polymerase III subunit RPC4
VVTAADWQLQAGRAGRLNVHASGRVTMDWGGISFELDRATAVDFLQEALIVSTPPNVTEDVVDDECKVWAMGQLSGKFTVTPDWEKML